MNLFRLLSFFVFMAIVFNASGQKRIKRGTPKDIVYTLASDEFEGRRRGTKGDTLSVKYISDLFKRNSLVSAIGKDSSYIQYVSVNPKMAKMFGVNNLFNITGAYSTPDTTKSYIIIGAHYDHLGMGGKMSGSRRMDTVAVHNGADDNASGVAGLVELSKRLNTREWRRLRKQYGCEFMFVAFGGEEIGLAGSKFFVENMPVPASRVKMMINYDMIGNLRNRSLLVGGVGTADELDAIVGMANVQMKGLAKDGVKDEYFKLTISKQGYGPSDHSSFYTKNIPVLYMTTGTTETYHTPDDDADRLNYAGIDSVVYFTENVLRRVVMAKSLTFRETGQPNDTLKRRSFKVTLGIMPDVVGTTDKGMKADVVIKGRPAANAGLLNGDVIIEMNGNIINNIEDYMKVLEKLAVGDLLKVKVIRDGKELSFDINL